MLDTDQRQRFAEQGYLCLPEAIDPELIAGAREQLWEAIPESRDEPEALVGVGSRSPDVPSDAPFTAINDQLYDYGSSLVGDRLVAPDGPDMQLAFRYPRDLRVSAYHDRRSGVGHLDGYGPGFKQDGEYTGFAVAGVVYFDQVAARGGGFTVWPGSHWLAAAYFRDHALNAPGYGGNLPAIDDSGGWDRTASLGNQLRSRELSGPPGTLILWHNKLIHGAGVNQSDRIRMAGIKRFRRDDHEAIKADAAAAPFAYWDEIEAPPAPGSDP